MACNARARTAGDACLAAANISVSSWRLSCRLAKYESHPSAEASQGHVMLLLGDLGRAQRHFAGAHAMARELGAEGNPLACLGEAVLGRRRGDVAYARERYAEALRLLNAQVKPDWTSAALPGLASVRELAKELKRLRLGVIDDSGRHSLPKLVDPGGWVPTSG